MCLQKPSRPCARWTLGTIERRRGVTVLPLTRSPDSGNSNILLLFSNLEIDLNICRIARVHECLSRQPSKAADVLQGAQQRVLNFGAKTVPSGDLESPGTQCVCLLLQYLLQSCLRGGRGIVEDMCYECVFITAVPITKLFAWGEGIVEDMCYERRRAEALVYSG